MTTKLLFLDNDGVIAEVSNGAISNIGGTTSSSFTVAGTPVMLADGRAADGSSPSWMNLQLVYDNSVATNGATRLVLAPGKDLDIGSNLSSYIRVDAETGKVTITGDLDVQGGVMRIDAVVQDADHWAITPNNPNVIALKIEPDEGVIPQTDLVAISKLFGESSVFRIDSDGNVYVVGDISVSGTVDGVDIAALRQSLITHMQSGQTRHAASDISIANIPALGVSADVQAGLESLTSMYSQLGAEVESLKIDKGVVLHEHIQNTASNVWTITHNGSTTRVFPAVAYDTSFNKIEYSSFEVISNNQVRVSFANPVIGRFFTGVLDVSSIVDLGQPTVVIPNILTNLSQMVDTDIQSPQEDQVLAFKNGFWTPSTPATSATLDDLTDVSTATASVGDVLTKGVNGWVASPVAKALNDLTDVVISNPSDSQVLVFNNGAFHNANLTLPTGVDSLTDVSIVDMFEGDVLTRRGTVWTASAPTLATQADVNFGTPLDGDLLTFHNGKWINLSNQYKNITDHDDVTLNNLVSGQVLVSTAAGWENIDLPPFVDQANDLSDFSIDTPQEGDTLVRRGGVWVNEARVTHLAHLTDVSDTTATAGKALIHNGTQWAPTSLPSFPNVPNTIDDLDDVLVAGANEGEVLAWNAVSQKWQNKDIGAVSSISDLNDIQITNPAEGQILVHRNSVWVNEIPDLLNNVALDDLTNVVAPTPSTGQFLRFNGTVWVPANVTFNLPPISVDMLSDAVITDPSQGQILMYDGTVWLNTTPQDAGVIPPIPSSLDDLSDVTIVSPSTGDYLRYNGSSFVASPADQVSLTLNQLTDVVTPTPSEGQVLTYQSGQWNAVSPIQTAIEELASVDIVDPFEGQQLVYHLGTWTNQTPAGIPSVLSDLTDISDTPPNVNQVLVFNGTQYVPTDLADGISNLNGVGDVSITTPEDGQVLTYSNGEWVNSVPTGLQAVSVSNATTGDIIRWNGTTWSNTALEGLLSFSNLSDAQGLSSGALSYNGNTITTFTPVSMQDIQDAIGGITTPSLVDLPDVAITATDLTNGVGKALVLQPDHSFALGAVSDSWQTLLSTLNPADGEILTFSATSGWGTSIPHTPLPTASASGFLLASVSGTAVSYSYAYPSIAGLSDASVSAPNDGDVLTYSTTLSKWVASSIPAPVLTIDALSDVNAPSPTAGTVLGFNGSAWVPTTVSAPIASVTVFA